MDDSAAVNINNVSVSLSVQNAQDQQGALMYVVAVISVYAMGIVFMIASHVRRRKSKREADHDIQVRCGVFLPETFYAAAVQYGKLFVFLCTRVHTRATIMFSAYHMENIC